MEHHLSFKGKDHIYNEVNGYQKGIQHDGSKCVKKGNKSDEDQKGLLKIVKGFSDYIMM